MRTEVTAIIYDKHGRALSIGKNSYTKTHPIMLKHGIKVGRPQKIYLHAEVEAILKCRNLDKAYRIAENIRFSVYKRVFIPNTNKNITIHKG